MGGDFMNFGEWGVVDDVFYIRLKFGEESMGFDGVVNEFG